MHDDRPSAATRSLAGSDLVGLDGAPEVWRGPAREIELLRAAGLTAEEAAVAAKNQDSVFELVQQSFEIAAEVGEIVLRSPKLLAEDEDALWITEVWDSETSHQASLSLPSVQEAIRQGRPLIAGFGER